MDEKLIANHMKVLGISREEAIELIESDKEIDKGAKKFDLDPELEKASKKARQVDRKPSTTKTKREKKVDDDKLHLMKIIETAIGHNPNCDSFEFTNPERECVFFYNGKKYKITLACPRS